MNKETKGWFVSRGGGNVRDKNGNIIPKYLYVWIYDSIKTRNVRKEKHQYEGKKHREVFGVNQKILIKRVDKIQNMEEVFTILQQKAYQFFLKNLYHDPSHYQMTEEQQEARKQKLLRKASEFANEKVQTIIRDWSKIKEEAYKE
ncbi:hypothetical protein [Geobacillus sp. WSUCF-018B]|uniref:hypothetical protein n=1 Tax=Geobacillus sp. WSUCF-018B TaxID=2055939 RepID=UPI0011AFC053|nr:hypothetical protein [Geobacillus sp. WSUCF-018B]